MAKTKLSEWSATASSNTDINSINIAEGMAPSDVNNAMREMMAQLKDFQTGADGDNLTVGGNLAVTGTSSFTGAATFGAASFSSVPSGVLPPGVIVPYAGLTAAAPTGWLFCNGAAVNRTTYAALFAIIGTAHGAGDGSTTFNLPDLRDKYLIGASADSSSKPQTNITGSYTQTGGSKDAIAVSHSHTGSAASNGDHTHTLRSQSGHANTVFAASGNAFQSAYAGSLIDSGNMGSAGAHTHTLTIDSAGSSGTNANLPPYYALGFIIKT
jgi:microcystin-dependent protein